MGKEYLTLKEVTDRSNLKKRMVNYRLLQVLKKHGNNSELIFKCKGERNWNIHISLLPQFNRKFGVTKVRKVSPHRFVSLKAAINAAIVKHTDIPVNNCDKCVGEIISKLRKIESDF